MAGDTSGVLQLATNGSTTAVTVDTSQNVGIGTASPSALLHVSNTSAKIRIGLTASSEYLDISRDNVTGYSIYNAAQVAPYGQHIFQVAGTEAMRIDSSRNVSITQTPGKYTIDVTGGSTSIANNGTVDFSSSSGMLVANNNTTGGITIYLFGGGSTTAIGSVIGAVGTAAYNAGIGGYRWTNNSGSTSIFSFFYIRTRTTG
jgi:hypothetical protein